MIDSKYFLNLPPISLNLLSGGIFVFIVCLGIRVARAPEIGLKVANTQLVVGDSANRLEKITEKLESQARTIKEKDEAYQDLLEVYQESTDKVKDDRRLKDAIRAIEELPELKNMDEVQVEIQKTEDKLIQLKEQ